MGVLLLSAHGRLFASLPEGLQPLSTAFEHVEALAALCRGEAMVVDLQQFLAATARLPPTTLVQATLAAALLADSGRPCQLQFLPAMLQGCAEAVPGLPSLPASVVSSCPFAAAPTGRGTSNAGGSPSDLFHLLYQLGLYSKACEGPPSVQLAGPQHAQRMVGQPPPGHVSGTAAAGQLPAPAPAAALRVVGQASEVYVRWGATADNWCRFKMTPGQRPSARCSCGWAGLGHLYCQHLEEAYCTLMQAVEPNVDPASAAAGGAAAGGAGAAGHAAASASSGNSSSSKGILPGFADALASAGSSGGGGPTAGSGLLLNVSALEWACSQMSGEQLSKLLLCTALYTGAGTVLTDGLGITAAELQPPGGAGLALQAGGQAGVLQALYAQGVMVGGPPASKQAQCVPGCCVGRWRAAALPAAAAATVGRPLLEHAAALLAPDTAEGVWACLGATVGTVGLPWHSRAGAQSAHSVPRGVHLLQTAQLLLSAGHQESGEHILKEWLVALSLPAAWQYCKPPSVPQLASLWRQHLPPAAQLGWWAQQGAPPQPIIESDEDAEDGEWLPHMHQQRQRLYGLCNTQFIELVGELMGPVAGAHQAAALLRSLEQSCCRSAALAVVTSIGLSAYQRGGPTITDLANPLPAAALWLETAEHTPGASALPQGQLLQLLDHLKKAQAGPPQPPPPQQPGAKKKGKGKKGGAAAAQAAPVPAQAQQARKPSLLLTAARSTARQLLDLPLTEAADLFERLIPDLQMVVMTEAAALQAERCRATLPSASALVQDVFDWQRWQGMHPQQFQQHLLAVSLGTGPRGQPAGLPEHHQGLAGLLTVASSTDVQDAPKRRRLTLAASRCILDLCQRHGRVAVARRLSPPGRKDEGWWDLADLVELSNSDNSHQYFHLLPPLLAALAALLRDGGQTAGGKPAANKKQSSKQQKQREQKAGSGQGSGGQPQQPAEAQGRVPADVLEHLAPMLPALLVDCCAAARDALVPLDSGNSSSSSLGRSSVGDCEALLLALSGVHSCMQIMAEVTAAASLSPEHAAAAGALKKEHPSPLLLALPVLLAVGEAAGPVTAGEAARISTHSTSTLRSVNWNDAGCAAAAALLQLLPALPLPVAADGAGSSAAAAAAAAATKAYGGPACLLDLLPQLLATSAALACSPHTSPPRHAYVALLWYCLAEVAADASGAVPPEQRVLAARSLLQLLLSPAAAHQLRICAQAPLLVNRCAERRQLADAGFQAAARVLPVLLSLSGGSGSKRTDVACNVARADVVRLAGDCAYLATNLLAASLAQHEGLSGGLVLPAGQTHTKTSQKEARQKLSLNAGWQLSALRLLSWWLHHSAELPVAPEAAAVSAAGWQAGMSGPPTPLFMASTLAGLLTTAVDPRVHVAALASLSTLAAADPLPLLHCDSLPLLVHAAAKKAHQTNASDHKAGSQWSPQEAEEVQQVQAGVAALLRTLRDASSAAGPAGVAALPLWLLWEQHAPAGKLHAGTQKPAAPGTSRSSAPAAPWDRVAAAAGALSQASAVVTPAGASSHTKAAAGAGGVQWGPGALHPAAAYADPAMVQALMAGVGGDAALQAIAAGLLGDDHDDYDDYDEDDDGDDDLYGYHYYDEMPEGYYI